MSIKKTRYSNKKKHYSKVSRKRTTKKQRGGKSKSIRKNKYSSKKKRQNRHTRKQRGGSKLSTEQEKLESDLLKAHTFVESLKKTEPIVSLKDLRTLIDLCNNAGKYRTLYLEYTDETNSKMLEEIKRIKASKGFKGFSLPNSNKHLIPIVNLRNLVEGLISLVNRYLDLVEVNEERHIATVINYSGDDLTSEPELLLNIDELLGIIWTINFKRSSQLRITPYMKQYESLRATLNYFLGCFYFIKGEEGYRKNRYYDKDFKEAEKYFKKLSKLQIESLNKDREIRTMSQTIGDRLKQFGLIHQVRGRDEYGRPIRNTSLEGDKGVQSEKLVRFKYENNGNVMVQIKLYYPGADPFGSITDGIILSNLNGTVTLTYNKIAVEFQITGRKIESPSVPDYIASNVLLESSAVPDESLPFIGHCLESKVNGLSYEPRTPYIGPSSKQEYGNRHDQFNKENFYNFIVNTVFGKLFSTNYEYVEGQDALNTKANSALGQIDFSGLPKYLAKYYQEDTSVILTKTKLK